MSSKKIILFFHSSNLSTAEQIREECQTQGFEFYFYDQIEQPLLILEENEEIGALLLISNAFLQDLPLMKLADQLKIRANSFFVLTDSIDADGHHYKTEIHTLSHIMAYRDYWYDEWIRLRKINHADANSDTHKDKIKWAKILSVNTVSALIRHINQTDYQYVGDQKIEWSSWLKKVFKSATNITSNTTNSVSEITDTSSFTTTEQSVVTSSAPPTFVMQDDEIQIMMQQTNIVDKSNELKVPEHTKTPKKEINMSQLPSLETIEQLIENKAFKKAKKELKQCIENTPQHVDAMIMLARLLNDHLNEPKKEIIKWYKKALSLPCDKARIYHEFGLVQQQFTAHGKAIELFRESIIHDISQPDVYIDLAHSLLHKGYIEKARANYLQATLLNKNYGNETLDDTFGVIRAKKQTQSNPEPSEKPSDIKTILVTGSSSGIGKAIAYRFIDAGHRVIISGRRKEKLDMILNELSDSDKKNNVVSLQMDVTDLKSIKTALSSLSNDFSNVDILINNAGLAKGKDPIHEGQFDHWNTMIDTNIKGILHMTRLISPGMVEQNEGHIINIGSIAGKEVYPGGSVYCASKAAVESLTKSMRLDLHAYNIKVSAVCPGHVDETEFAEVRYDDAAMNAIYDDFKPLSAKDVADTVFYIATRPSHVNIQDVLMFGTQQANATTIHRTGRSDR